MGNAGFGAVLDFLHKAVTAEELRELPDADLLQRFLRERLDAAFSVLVHRHGPMVMGVCRRVLGDAHSAEDAFQATFMVLARRAGAVLKHRPLGNWLYGVAHRVALRTLAKNAARQRTERELANMPRENSQVDVTWQELRSILDEEIAQLPQKDRAPIVLCYFEGMSYERAAQELGCPKSSLASRLTRAREVLRQRLTQRGMVLSATALATMLTEKSASAAVGAMLTINTVKAAASIATGKTMAAGVISAAAVALAEETMKGMIGIKAKLMVAIMVLGLTVGGASVAGYGALSERAAAVSTVAEAKTPNTAETALAQQGKKGDKTAPQNLQKPIFDLYGDPLPEGAFLRLGTQRFRHHGPITSVAWSPDSKWIASGGGFLDNTIRLWDAASGKEIRKFKTSPTEVHTVAVAPDGSLVVSVDKDGMVRLWETATGKSRGEKQMRLGASVVFSAKGDSFASIDEDGQACLVDCVTLNTLREFTAECEPQISISIIAWSADRMSLATVDARQKVRVFDTVTGKVQREFDNANKVKCLSFSPNGQTLAIAGEDQAISLWDVSNGKLSRKLVGPTVAIKTLAWSPDGKTLASGGGFYAWIWDVEKGVGRHKLYSPQVQTVGFSPNGKWLATAGDNAMRIWDVESGQAAVNQSELQGRLGTLAALNNGKTLLTGGNYAMRLWDASNGKMDSEFSVRLARPKAGAISSDGTMFAAGAGTGMIELHELPSGKTLKKWQADNAAMVALCFSPDAKVLASSSKSNKTLLWDVASGQIIRELAHPVESMLSFAFSHDGKLLFTGSDKGKLRMWDLASGQEVGQFIGHKSGINQLVCTLRNEKLLASVSYDGTTRLWDMTTSKSLWSFKTSGVSVSAAFSVDGRMLAIGEEGGLIRLWELATGKQRATLGGNQGEVATVSFLPDGKTLVSGGADSTVLCWDLRQSGSDKTPPLKNLSATEVDVEWQHLFGNDVERSYRALLNLAASPEQALSKLQKNLQPVPHVDAKTIAQWIAELEDKTFAVRIKAVAKLKEAGDVAWPALRKVLEKPPSLETRDRIQLIVGNQNDPLMPVPDRLRLLRSLELLERIESRDALAFAQSLTNGAPEAWLTQEAMSIAARMKDRR